MGSWVSRPSIPRCGMPFPAPRSGTGEWGARRPDGPDSSVDREGRTCRSWLRAPPRPTGSPVSRTRSSPRRSVARRANRSSAPPGLSPSGPDPPGQPARGHDPAPGRRRDPPARATRCEHLISWDDYDRFRKVPAGVDGRGRVLGRAHRQAADLGARAARQRRTRTGPSTSRPPWSTRSPSWASSTDGISQTEQYTSGAYREQILLRDAHRGDIDAILDQYRTQEGRSARQEASRARSRSTRPSCEARRGLRRGRRGRRQRGAGGYFPYKPYCGDCEQGPHHRHRLRRRDHRADATPAACGLRARPCGCSEFNRGKLVWKVDWPMRWAYEGVVFEPVRRRPLLARLVLRRSAGRSCGRSSAASSPSARCTRSSASAAWRRCRRRKGGVPTPADALEIMEAPLLRWLYARRRPNQSFKIAFDQEIQRLYDEWDTLERKVADGSGAARRTPPRTRAPSRTAAGELPRTPRPLPYRTLASVADITAGARRADAAHPERPRPGATRSRSLDEVRPRLDRPSAGSPPRSRPSSAPSCATSPTPSCWSR